MRNDTISVLVRWLSPKDAAEYLGCSRNFLDKARLTNIPPIPFTRLGRHIRYDRNDLDAFLEGQKQVLGTTTKGEEIHG